MIFEILQSTVPAAVTAVLAFIFTKRKYAAEAESSEYAANKAAFENYRMIIDDLRTQIEENRAQIEENREEIEALRTSLHAALEERQKLEESNREIIFMYEQILRQNNIQKPSIVKDC
jgi:flagellar biosynthesis chaperone FliJ